MKTIKLVLIAFLVLPLGFWAQENPILKKQIRNYTQKIDSIVSAEKKLMNAELDEVEKRFSDNQISETEKQKLNKEIAQKYEKSINEKVNVEKSMLEDITQTAVNDAVFGTPKNKEKYFRSSRNAILELGYDMKEIKDPEDPKNYLSSFGYVFNISLLNHTSEKALFDFGNHRQLKTGLSGGMTIRYEGQLGKYTSPVFYRLGLGWRVDEMEVRNSKVFAQDEHRLFITDFQQGELKYASLRTDYIMLPAEVIFVLNPKYKSYQGREYIDNTKKQFRIGVGVYGGVKINDWIFTEYKNNLGNEIRSFESVSPGLNGAVFGGKLSFGYSWFNIYVTRDFTPIFKENADVRNKYATQIGVDIIALTF